MTSLFQNTKNMILIKNVKSWRIRWRKMKSSIYNIWEESICELPKAIWYILGTEKMFISLPQFFYFRTFFIIPSIKAITHDPLCMSQLCNTNIKKWNVLTSKKIFFWWFLWGWNANMYNKNVWCVLPSFQWIMHCLERKRHYNFKSSELRTWVNNTVWKFCFRITKNFYF